VAYKRRDDSSLSLLGFEKYRKSTKKATSENYRNKPPRDIAIEGIVLKVTFIGTHSTGNKTQKIKQFLLGVLLN
jgi:phage terminase large subunit-like protein